MTPPTNTRQPSLSDLMNRFLAAKGAAADTADDDREVEPYEVAGGFRTPTKTTWDEALAAFKLFGVEPEKVAVPAEWAAFAGMDHRVAVSPLAAGLFPQRVRSIPQTAPDAAAWESEQVSGLSGLRGWVRKALRSQSATQLLLAAGVAAALGDHDDADAAMTAAKPLCEAGAWQSVWVNQEAAVLAMRGKLEEASKLLNLLDPTEPVVALNRGLTELALGNSAAAEKHLAAAAQVLPEISGWNHLCHLFLTMAKA